MLGLLLTMMLEAGAQPLPTANPEWIRRPNGEDLGRHYPEHAARLGLSGRATMSCSVTAEGTLVDCTVIEESPPGEGFGEAALRLSPLFKMRPMSRDGRPVAGGTVRIPMRFQVPGANVDPITGLSLCYGLTAAAAQKDRSNLEAMAAYGFYAAQLAIRSAQEQASPEIFETRLSSARTMALAGAKTPNVNVSLRKCISIIPKPPPLPKPKPSEP